MTANNEHMPDHPSRFELSRLHAGELGPDEQARLEHHISECAECRALVDELNRARQDFHAGHEREVILAGIRARAQAERKPDDAPAAGRAGWFAALLRPRLPAPLIAIAAVLTLVVFIATPQDSGQTGERLKGGRIELSYWVMRAGRPRLAEPGQILHPGDRIQFRLTAPAGGYVHVVGIDESGKLSLYFPRSTDELAVFPGGAGRPVPGSIILDQTLGRERVFVIICKRPLSENDISTSARQLPGGATALISAERMPLECKQAGITLHKEAR